MIRFRKSLGPFQKYHLKTRAIYWDEKWFYFEQRFERGGELIAVGRIKGLLRGPEGNIPTAEVFKALRSPVLSPPLPLAIERWREMEESDEDSRPNIK